MLKERLIREIELLPADLYPEIMDFIGYLKIKSLKNVPEPMLLSERSLAEDWDAPEEDEAWASL